jgi:hypothetical protein|eukprot:COSAG06_NODE_28489_length_573_cov_0.974684_1_plen_78_part_00
MAGAAPGVRERKAPNFVTPSQEELAQRCVIRPREPVQREPPEGCLEVFVDLLFSDFTPVAIIFLVYVVLYALYHFHG